MPAIDGTQTLRATERAVPPPPIPRDAARPPHVQRVEEPRPHTDLLKVSTHSRPSAVAGAIAGVLRQQPRVEVHAIGAGATNQAVKAIVIARRYLQDDDLDVWCVPAFLDVMLNGDERTALRLVLERRAR